MRMGFKRCGALSIVAPAALLAIFALPAALEAGVSFDPSSGTGAIAKSDIVDTPGLGMTAVIAEPGVRYLDRITYQQSCVDKAGSQLIVQAFDRERNLTVTAEPATAKPLNGMTITGYKLSGYWTVLLSTIPDNLCYMRGLMVAGPMTLVKTSGGRLSFKGSAEFGDVVIWIAGPN